MKNIEIKTTQNVVLEYELASLRERAIAYIIDLICIIAAILVLSIFFLTPLGYDYFAQKLILVMMICVFVFYAPAIEIISNGQSVGKMAMKIQVIKAEGGNATFSDYAGRWAFRMIDIYFSLTGIGAILIASSAKAQRIGDIVAGTAVIRLTPATNLRLKDLLKMHDQHSYVPKYLQVKQLAEDEVLLIKNVLERYQKFRNPSHLEALEQTATEIRKVLSIEGSPGDSRIFLQTLIKDYVVLTR